MENILEKQKINLNLKKFNISKIIIYFAFYSFIGFCFESIFGIFSKGVLECRQSFLFGPFCAIYGIGACLMIAILSPFRSNFPLIFFGSCILGAFSEYFMSYICEIYFHFKWWDYSNFYLNIHGRTCLFFILIWGILGTLLIEIVNPKLNLVINKIKTKIPKKVFDFAIFGLFTFLIIDIFLTSFALKYFYAKISIDYNLPNCNYSIQIINKLSNFNILKESNLLKTFPNIRIAGKKYDNVFVDTLYKVSPTYYFKFFDKEYD